MIPKAGCFWLYLVKNCKYSEDIRAWMLAVPAYEIERAEVYFKENFFNDEKTHGLIVEIVSASKTRSRYAFGEIHEQIACENILKVFIGYFHFNPINKTQRF